MPKKPHVEETQTSSKATLTLLVAGGIAVAGLVGWALTRTVEPASPAVSTASLETGVATPSSDTATTLTGGSTEPISRAVSAGEKSAVARIAVEDLHSRMGRDAVTVIDVRPADAFATAHIPGSLNMPLATIEAQVGSIPPDKPIVTYCT